MILLRSYSKDSLHYVDTTIKRTTGLFYDLNGEVNENVFPYHGFHNDTFSLVPAVLVTNKNIFVYI